jgi:Fanconi anemia group M protein
MPSSSEQWPTIGWSSITLSVAPQGSKSGETALTRYGRKPRRLATRRLFVLQGLPGVGPALGRRPLAQLGSVERVMTADPVALGTVRGIGPKRAARIRELLTG